MTPDAVLDRALGALYGLAIGDALGMPTEGLSRAEIAARFGEISGFLPGDDGRAALPAGRVTDDTEQALLIAELLVAGPLADGPLASGALADGPLASGPLADGPRASGALTGGPRIAGAGVVDPHRLVAALLDWERRAVESGTGMLLGPSTKAALLAARSGVPLAETGRAGTTNGAAMRITPVGVALPPEPLDRLVDSVVAVDAPTHHTGVAHAGAAAVAAAVSSGVAGAPWPDSLALAVRAADLAATRGFPPDGAEVVRRLREQPASLAGIAARGLGVATAESVSAAFALATLAPDDPWRVTRWAAGLGGDTDTIAAIAGALTGAHAGASALPPAARETVRRVNALDLELLAGDLVRLRRLAAKP